MLLNLLKYLLLILGKKINFAKYSLWYDLCYFDSHGIVRPSQVNVFFCNISKRSVWREVRNGHVHVNTAEQYSIVAQCNRNIHVHYISKTEIDAIDDKLTTLWEGVLTISRTHKYHFFKTSREENMKVAETSKSDLQLVIGF